MASAFRRTLETIVEGATSAAELIRVTVKGAPSVQTF
jgi:hypothetical protein